MVRKVAELAAPPPPSVTAPAVESPPPTTGTLGGRPTTPDDHATEGEDEGAGEPSAAITAVAPADGGSASADHISALITPAKAPRGASGRPQSADDVLPSASTCTNYLKLPEYTRWALTCTLRTQNRAPAPLRTRAPSPTSPPSAPSQFRGHEGQAPARRSRRPGRVLPVVTDKCRSVFTAEARLKYLTLSARCNGSC